MMPCRAAETRASVAAHYDTVASIYRLAYVEELIPSNPCARIPRPKVHRDLQHREVLTVLEYAAYLTVTVLPAAWAAFPRRAR